jgi:hypothetical protein
MVLQGYSLVSDESPNPTDDVRISGGEKCPYLDYERPTRGGRLEITDVARAQDTDVKLKQSRELL